MAINDTDNSTKLFTLGRMDNNPVGLSDIDVQEILLKIY